MPEGDTIFRAARTLSRALAGQTLVRFDSPLPELSRAALGGVRIDAVDARGKYLVVRFADGRTLVTHMKMTGSWHVYPRGERWRKAPSRARAVLETERYVAICFDAPVVRLLSAERARRDLASLGPDLLAPDADLAAALARIRGEPFLSIAEAITQQRLVAGVGNVIKSEALFLARIDPRAPVRDLAGPAIARVLTEAQRILRANVAPTARGPRRTRGGRSPLWVYGRQGSPCFVCKTPIVRIYQGALGARRSTYFCPTCEVSS